MVPTKKNKIVAIRLFLYLATYRDDFAAGFLTETPLETLTALLEAIAGLAATSWRRGEEDDKKRGREKEKGLPEARRENSSQKGDIKRLLQASLAGYVSRWEPSS